MGARSNWRVVGTPAPQRRVFQRPNFVQWATHRSARLPIVGALTPKEGVKIAVTHRREQGRWFPREKRIFSRFSFCCLLPLGFLEEAVKKPRLANLSLNPSRPSSSELVELHIFYVPEGSWNYKLNTISLEFVDKFISAGFLRVSLHLTLQALREHLGEFLGEDAVAEKFLFLKYIGNNLAVVKANQESELKLKSFVPPYTLQPELYLLPVMDHFGNIYSASTVSSDGQQTNNGVAEAVKIIHRPLRIKECITLPGLTDFPSLPCQPAAFPEIPDISLLQIERRKIIKQMKRVKEERKHLQRIREELIKVEKQYEQSTLKQYHACDSWKKKYLETKKVTGSLEEVLATFREDSELYYKKLLTQLKAREVKMKPKNMAYITNSKNYLILQITEVQHAIDQLKRKSDSEKIKLIVEAKMRKQAISDVRTLKAELTQNKIHTSLQPQLGM
ncbi:spermatogenesis-associated protein 1 [Pteronotus mesoamericanus]|uniref:spermatogenesis-associated protein 1 n=1 Tax=Pteronotus mesoamericanus TaxID=1884717 RepID=UPI0023EDA95D|nr:spermatogenesis-associated protein 1 [Pteronotus parnellii mesoamericanus]